MKKVHVRLANFHTYQTTGNITSTLQYYERYANESLAIIRLVINSPNTQTSFLALT